MRRFGNYWKTAVSATDALSEPELKPFCIQTRAVRKTLGDGAFQSAWEEGSQWSLEEAVKRVLGE